MAPSGAGRRLRTHSQQRPAANRPQATHITPQMYPDGVTGSGGVGDRRFERRQEVLEERQEVRCTNRGPLAVGVERPFA